MSNVRTVSFGIRLKPETHDGLIQLAALHQTHKTRLIAIAVQEYLERNATNGNAPKVA